MSLFRLLIGFVGLLLLTASLAWISAPIRPALAREAPETAATRPYQQDLETALAIYGAIAERGGWPSFAAGESLRLGDSDSRVPILRRVLAATGDLPARDQSGFASVKAGLVEGGDSARTDQFDPLLDRAVRAFQDRHGLEVDGVVGPRTRAALNVGVDRRIAQIRANLERVRSLATPEARYVLVNAGGQTVTLIEDGAAVLSMRAIVGLPSRQTPDLSSRITTIEFNPFWNVPDRIALLDILPKVKRDPGYLAERKIRVFSGWNDQERILDPDAIDWSRLGQGNLPYRLRQDPGPRNALGRIKFTFPNRHGVFMHDTPDRHLFDRPMRNFSSGCIRIEQPVELATALLAADQRWTRSEIEAAIDTGETRKVELREPVPIHLVYVTVWLDRLGRVQLRDDVYGRLRDHPSAMAVGGCEAAATMTWVNISETWYK